MVDDVHNADVQRTAGGKSLKKNAEYDLRPGEKGFTILLLVICAFLFYRSRLLWNRFPGMNGPAMVPMMASGLATILLLFSVIGNIRKRTPLNGGNILFHAKIKMLREYLVSKNIVVSLIFIVCFCILLRFGVPFYIVVSIFLWGLMSFLAKGDYLKNVLWTVLCLAFIAIVFGMLFNVVMP